MLHKAESIKLTLQGFDLSTDMLSSKKLFQPKARSQNTIISLDQNKEPLFRVLLSKGSFRIVNALIFLGFLPNLEKSLIEKGKRLLIQRNSIIRLKSLD